MATSIEDLRAITAAQRASGKNYMMMETAVYTRQFLYARELKAQGAFGRIQLLRGAHYQDMERWPPYWAGLPPMWYATHAISPLLAIAEARATRVHCFGSGEMRPELHAQYGNLGLLRRQSTSWISPSCSRSDAHTVPLCAALHGKLYGVWRRCLLRMADGTRRPVAVPHDARYRQSGAPGDHRATDAADRADLLPPSVGKYTRRFVYNNEDRHLSFEQGGGHHGSHPHLVHEFVRSIVERRSPWINAVTAANWTAAGICAHESAMLGGVEIAILLSSEAHMTPMALPPLLMVSEPGSFAEHTIVQRKPQIIADIIAHNAYPPEIVAGLRAFEREIASEVVAPLSEETEDIAFWRDAWMPWQGKKWRELGWFFAETYFYRRVLEIVRYFQPGPWLGRDPFRPQKQAAIAQGLKVVAQYAPIEDAPLEQQACVWLHRSLWGNRADLSNLALRDLGHAQFESDA